ncbi:MAG TPA: SDR family NAD(P)-dependent oxidoreductase [Nevskiaceae bacterium]
MATSQPSCACIVGVGPGLGAALTERFAAEGYAVALLSRSATHRDPIVRAITANGGRAAGYDCDVTDPASVTAAFAKIRATHGDPAVLIYNAGVFVVGGLLELDPARFEDAWRINCLGAFLCARQVVPAMRAARAGSLLFTGATASLRGGARFAGLAVGKFGLRALSQSLAREWGSHGIHVANVIIDGQIGNRGRSGEQYLDPHAIAESYWQLHRQPRSAWTLEMDLRPHVEHF